MPTATDRYLDLNEVAEYLGLSKQTLYDMIHDKRLPFPFVKMGKPIRVKKSELEKYLEKRTVKQC